MRRTVEMYHVPSFLVVSPLDLSGSLFSLFIGMTLLYDTRIVMFYPRARYLKLYFTPQHHTCTATLECDSNARYDVSRWPGVPAGMAAVPLHLVHPHADGGVRYWTVHSAVGDQVLQSTDFTPLLLVRRLGLSRRLHDLVSHSGLVLSRESSPVVCLSLHS